MIIATKIVKIGLSHLSPAARTFVIQCLPSFDKLRQIRRCYVAARDSINLSLLGETWLPYPSEPTPQSPTANTEFFRCTAHAAREMNPEKKFHE
jgi:hypothetical protein